jgi:predicted DNA-binding protein (UPF0251 family)
MPNMRILEECPLTPKEQEVVDLRREGLTVGEITKKLGVSQSTVSKRLSTAVRKASHQQIDLGFRIKGKSIHFSKDGQISGWLKTERDDELQQQIIEAGIAAMAETLPKAMPAVLRIKNHQSELCNVFTITDFHLGMLAWSEETGGEDWDLNIAEELLVKWFAAALKSAPRAQVGIFNQLGDFLHFDGLDAITPTSGHLLDSDTRFQKLVRVAIRVIRRVIQMMLQYYPEVHVKMCEGNHDIAGSVWLREFLAAHYENEPRITIDQSAQPYYCYEHGKTAIFFHHGHKRKIKEIDTVFVAKFREVFGRTKYAYAHMGHLHHLDVKEGNLMVVKQHRTLAANDAHGARLGFTSGREACVTTYHKEFGQVGEITLTPEMVR